MTEVVEKKKRGRKKKEVANDNIVLSVNVNVNEEPVVKKRGRKPKGGKIIVKNENTDLSQTNISNIILHLKCSSSDINENDSTKLTYNPSVPPEIETYNENKTNFFVYENTNESNNIRYAYTANESNNLVCSKCNDDIETPNDSNIKDINAKLKSLKINLYKNTLTDKKSACFWCTYEFDNPPCYIPKSESNESFSGYGSFCRPECAVAFLMKENIDDSTRFERYNILNHIYSKVYNFNNNIKPAPNPHYLLDKFYGNLTIQEYRQLLNSEHLLMIIDKPMTRILPELFEDNDNFVTSIYGNSKTIPQQTTMYKVKRQSDKKETPSKNSIIRDTFGVSTN
jgi:hypothetical protein